MISREAMVWNRAAPSPSLELGFGFFGIELFVIAGGVESSPEQILSPSLDESSLGGPRRQRSRALLEFVSL